MDKEIFCHKSKAFNNQDQEELREISQFIRRECKLNMRTKLPLIWLEADASGDEHISFLNTVNPSVYQIFTEIVDVHYSATFMFEQGKAAIDILNKAVEKYKGQFILVVEGAIPINYKGLCTIIYRTREKRVTALEVIENIAPQAAYIIALGTCAAFGGPSAARPNICGNVGLDEILPAQKNIINVSGCPANPNWFVGTLAHIFLYGMPKLDENKRPLLFYEYTVHKHCNRRSYHDHNIFATSVGQVECMRHLGCKGPETHADCPYQHWVNHQSFPIQANTPCIGCTKPDFPDGSMPFFTPFEHKSNKRGVNEDGAK